MGIVSANHVVTPCPDLPTQEFPLGWYNLTAPSQTYRVRPRILLQRTILVDTHPYYFMQLHFYAGSKDQCYYSLKVGHATTLLKNVAVTRREDGTKHKPSVVRVAPPRRLGPILNIHILLVLS